MEALFSAAYKPLPEMAGAEPVILPFSSSPTSRRSCLLLLLTSILLLASSSVFLWPQIFNLLPFMIPDSQEPATPIQTANQEFYTAGVVEHLVVPPRHCAQVVCSYEEALLDMQPNIGQFKQMAAEAAAKGVDILLFPEDGLSGFEFPEPAMVYPFLQEVPAPGQPWAPCNYPERLSPQSSLVVTFSCLALTHGLYIALNMGRMEGQRRYNTDVVFDRQGRLVARYDKRNLFLTELEIFSIPPLEVVTFQTDFGLFGIITCFDAIFQHPFIDLVEGKGISSLVFLTAWWNTPPLFTSLGFHSSLARGAQINYLASNRNYPAKGQTGSGIYTTDGVLASLISPLLPISRLLTARVPVSPNKYPVSWPARASSLPPLAPLPSHPWIVFHDTFNGVEGSMLREGWNKVCQREFCCVLQVPQHTNLSGYTLGAFSGQHTVAGKYHMEICLLTAHSPSSPMAGSVSLAGLFSSPHVYPQATLQDSKVAEFSVSPMGEVTASLQQGQASLHTLGIIARLYQLDSENPMELIS